MESLELAGPVGYLSMGILFFLVVWGMVEKVSQDIFGNKTLGRLLGLVIATYGFWYPFVPVLRIFYLVFLSAVAVFGTGFSRVGIVAKWALRGNRIVVAGVVIALILFEIIQFVVLEYLYMGSYRLAATVISWGLLVYGITGIEFIGPVIESTGLPRANLIQVAFVLACVIFLPLEFPAIYTLMSGAAILGSISGWVYFSYQQ